MTTEVETVIGNYIRLESPTAGRDASGLFTRVQEHCNVPGCRYPHHCKGYCTLHYDRIRRTGSPDGAKKRDTPTHCSVDDCGKDHYSKGYCKPHYYRWNRTGNPLPQPRKKAPKAPKPEPVAGGVAPAGTELHKGLHIPQVGPGQARIIDGRKTCGCGECLEPVYSRGYCMMHYNRWARTGNPLGLLAAVQSAEEVVPFVPVSRRCTIAGCKREQTARTYCKSHYRRWLDYGDPEGTPDTRENPGELPDHLRHYLERRRERISRQEKARHLRN